MNILVTKSNSSVAMGVIKSIPKEHNIISVGFDEYSPVGNFVNKNYKIEDLNDIYDIIIILHPVMNTMLNTLSQE